MNVGTIVKLAGGGIGAVIFLSMGLSSCTTIDSSEVGLVKRFGEVENTTLQPGLHFVNPFTTDIERMNTQTQPMKGTTPVYTSDLQTATVAYNLQFKLPADQAVKMRRTVGHDWSTKLIPPIVESSIKTVFGRITAANAIANRDNMQAAVLAEIRQKLANRGISVEDFQLTNVDYSDAFEEAVEKAQVATQSAIEAKNATVRITEQAKQREIQATAEANAIRVQAAAITQNPAIVQMRAVEKWDGHLPENMYGANAVPFIGQK